ncbi:MAG: BREX-1 system adenine-specific DNA-methyltransferase PglX [Lachnospira sp.]|nr:BREX-1 system adenine-specific DNA-methyltransferase PglX [Lachnospira sp.]
MEKKDKVGLKTTVALMLGCNSCNEANESGKKWFPYNKGGAFRRWYGNREYVVNWENDGFEIKHFCDEKGKLRSRPQNLQYYFKPSITWSDITSASFSGRYSEKGFIFDIKGSSGFPDEEILPYVLGFLNSSVSQNCIKILNPTITTQVGDMARIPVIIDSNKRREVEAKVSSSISISKTEWDSFEISWDFKKHPLCKNIPYYRRCSK